MSTKEEYKEKVKSLKGKSFTDEEYKKNNYSIKKMFSEESYRYILDSLFENDYIENYEININKISDRLYLTPSLDFNFGRSNLFFRRPKFVQIFKRFILDDDISNDRDFIEVLKDYRYDEIKFKVPVMFRL